MATYAKFSIPDPFNKGEVINHCDVVELLEDGTIKDCRGLILKEFTLVSEQDYIADLDAMFATERKRARNRRRYL